VNEHAGGSLALIERFLDHVDRGEWASLPELYAEDAIVEQPFAKPAPLRLQGREAIRAHFASAARAPLRLRVTHRRVLQTLDPEVIVAEYDYDGHATTTGHAFVVANVQIFRVRAGQIVASRDYHDHLAFAAALSRAPLGGAHS
jgi:ketosteroid isomerase-like protein